MQTALERLRGMQKQRENTPNTPGDKIDKIDKILSSMSMLVAIRARLALLHERIVALRLAVPPKGTVSDGLRWIQQEAGRLTALAADAGLLLEGESGNAAGYIDESDPFAAWAFSALVEEIKELECGVAAGRYPTPWPEGIDAPNSGTVFAAGRLLNGKFHGCRTAI